MSLSNSNKEEAGVLSSLIDAGADAFQNLFKIDISGNSNETCRITNFVAPERSITTVSLPYMNSVVTMPAPGSNINNIQKFNIRVDENYTFYSFFKEKTLIGPTGSWEFSPSKLIPSITVTLLAPGYMGFVSKYKWIFNDCYIIGVEPISMDYSSSGNVTAVVSFVYRSLTESTVSASGVSEDLDTNKDKQ